MEIKRLSLGQRIAKNGMHYLIVIPPLLWLLFAKLVPFVNDVHLAFIDFKPFRGMWGSPWVGLDNFRSLFANSMYRHVLSNTLSMKIGFMLLSGFAAFVLALSLSAIRSRPVRGFFQTLFLMPYFLPTLIFAYVAAAILSPSQQALFPVRELLLGRAEWFQPLIILLETVKTCGIPILLALAAIEHRQGSLIRRGMAGSMDLVQRMGPAARGIAAYMALQAATLLSVDSEMLHYLVNPLVYQTGDTLDTFQFRTGFMAMDTGLASTSWLLQFVVQMLLAFLAYAAVRGLFMRDLFGETQQYHGEDVVKADVRDQSGGRDASGTVIGIVISAIYAVVVLSLLYVLFVRPFLTGGNSEIRLGDVFSGGNFVMYLVLYVIMIAVGMAMTLLLAYPLTARDLPGRGLYKAILIVMMGMGQLSFSQYVFVKDLGMVNTIFSQVWAGFFTIAGVFVLKSWFNSRYGAMKEQLSANGQGEGQLFFSLFIPKVWKPLLALGVLQFVSLWGSFYASLIYFNNPEHYSPLMQFMRLATGGNGQDIAPGDPAVMQLAALIALPPIVLLLVFRKLLTAETLLSQVRKG